MTQKYQKKPKNKVLLSAGLIVASALYAFSQYTGDSPAAATQNKVATSASTSGAQTKTVATTANVRSASGYTNGTYTGSAVDAYYGTVQVKAVVQSGKLASVQFVQYPSDRSTSRAINGRAMPALSSEAIAAQSANVNIVSGATFTSQAFQQSLQSALSHAQA